MNPLTPDQYAKRERTLRGALLLSLWGPLATGIAVLLSQSSTQLADFVRRSVELAALTTSWLVFRHLMHRPQISAPRKHRLEQIAGRTVAFTMGLSGLSMLLYTLLWRLDHTPGGNVYPGLVIAFLGFGVNVWFWRRYGILVRESYSLLLDSQKRLYLSKSIIDLSVMIALSSVALFPEHPGTILLDWLGSVVVSVYLLWSSVIMFRRTAPRASRKPVNSKNNR